MHPPLVAVSLLLALGSGRPVPTQGDVPRLVKELGDDRDTQRRMAAYNALMRERPTSALPLLVEALPGYDLNCQSLGMSLLQMYPRDQVEPFLRKLLRGPSAFLEMAAAAILLRDGDSSVTDHIAGPLLRQGVPAAELSMMLGRLYYGIDDPRVRGAVRSLVTRAVGPGVLDNALYFLLLCNDREAIPIATELLAAPGLSSDNRAILAAFLVALGDIRHSPILAAEIRDRGWTAFGRMQRFLQRAPQLADEVIDAILAFVEKGEQAAYLTSAVRILAQHATPKVIPVLRKLLKDDNAQVAKAALDALADLPGGLAPNTLQQLLSSPLPELALAAADSLRRMDDLSGLPRVIELAKPDGTHRLEAVRVLGGFRRPAAVPPLLEALAADELPVRTQGLQGLSAVLSSLHPYRRFDLQATGYTPSAPAAQREDARRRILAWWEANRPRGQ